MNYTHEEIEKYIKILQSLDMNIIKNGQLNQRVTCNNCNFSVSFIESGYYYCSSCGFGLGHVLGYNDKLDYDRTNFYQKSIYQRKYHFQNKIEEENTNFNLLLN